MKPKWDTVTETELAILRELWERGTATIGDLTDTLYDERTAPQYATVQKLLERLETKNCVARDRSTRAHQFRATVSRNDFLGNRLQQLANKLCGGSLTPLLTTLVQLQDISPQDRHSLRQLIDQLDTQNQSKPRRKGKGESS